MTFGRLLVAIALCSSLSFCQKPEYAFYPDFRNVFVPKLRQEDPSIRNDAILARYTAKLRADGVPDEEIARRSQLIKTKREILESDYYDRFYSDPDSKFNRAPNEFLVRVLDGRKAGTALDYAMGQGRNSIYMAQQGWEVWGFDPAEGAVAVAQKRAKELGLTLHTSGVRDSEYEFGKNKFDLILFSWAMPFVPVQRVVDALKPGGIVVMECAVDYVGRNGMLKMFDDLQVVSYEIVKAKADFYNQDEVDVLRMIARKP